MTAAYIALGANLGDRLATLQSAIDRLSELGSVSAISAIYETDPVGYLDQPQFFNAVARVETTLPASELMAALLEIEAELGRVRTFANAPRAIDLDLLLYGDEVIDELGLTVPHPRMLDRAFVLAPLSDIAGEVSHPVTGRSIAYHLAALGPIEGISRTSARLALPR